MSVFDNRQLQLRVIEAALHAAGLDEVRVKIDGQGGCQLSGCVADLAQEALARQVVTRAGIENVECRLEHLDVQNTAVEIQTWRVRRGETWWSIAEDRYGAGDKGRALRAFNGAPATLKAGDIIVLPSELS